MYYSDEPYSFTVEVSRSLLEQSGFQTADADDGMMAKLAEEVEMLYFTSSFYDDVKRAAKDCGFQPKDRKTISE